MIDITDIPELKQDPLRYVLHNEVVNHTGLWLEFGTWKGQSIDLISQYTENDVYGFDTFSGLDDFWTGTPLGSMKVFDIGGVPPTSVIPINPNIRHGSSIEESRPFRKNVKFICGLFEDTLPKFLNSFGLYEISFLHIDCDLYRSTKTIFQYCGSLLNEDCVIVFDELLNYPNYEEHELKAFSEFLNKNSNFNIEWIGFKGCSAACRGI